ncbi:Yvc1p KNAG_0I01090 [Huiozyma naganishii CBS 8797]|uniref:Ion transport domain-containing protein n=1 Tax=Huiozyma naganishii (strain ATCC MYA-139 / BCRC 22969 / CBS 8797 / KCTC 17520 / NBRC 10181 / NCYC 3082 / Yp74L-3) TaxID=1071383 RepID=J7RAJ7_HUIN7|nr:hypothetical protein KNAG_0I01090 [Kazachstania naganishii CBS 8797]CCK71900.1 hypothetical protein KNAG_0I01090 [Kazachstania naganishii CBS 8797]
MTDSSDPEFTASLLPFSQADCTIERAGSIVFDPPTSRQNLCIAVNLKYIIDKTIPLAIDIHKVTCENSAVITDDIVQLAYEACGGNANDKSSLLKYRSVIIFALLNVYKWYEALSIQELHSFDLYQVRAAAAQQLCKIVIDREETRDLHFTFLQLLLRRYSINENDEDSEHLNSLELATDLHCTIVIGCSGFQRCLKWIWRGWIIQSRLDPKTFIKDETVSSLRFLDHFNPDRIKTPMYQNILQLVFCVIFLILYTLVVNGKHSKAVEPLDFTEVVFYLFTFGHISSEISKFYYIGYAYFSFWTCFNDIMYSIICISMYLRFVCFSPMKTTYPPEYWDRISYRILSCAAPFVWSRLLLYLESQRFVGIMLVVLKHMMTESLVFFVLLFLITVGFLQGFLGLDSSDGERNITVPILVNLIITVLGAGSFATFENFVPPYAGVLYYGYCFIVSVILLNILIALYSNAYQKVVDNADEEYMALMSQKALRYIRAPDEDVYVSPFNLIELLMVPVMKVLDKRSQRALSHFVMTFLYAPMLLFVSFKEIGEARRIKYNRMKRLPDDANESDTIWDLTDGYVDNHDNIFSTDNRSGIHATQKKNRESLSMQRQAERLDINFLVPEGWFKKVKTIIEEKDVDPLEKFTENLQRSVDERLDSTDQKIEQLIKTIDQLSNMLKELKGQKEEAH